LFAGALEPCREKETFPMLRFPRAAHAEDPKSPLSQSNLFITSHCKQDTFMHAEVLRKPIVKIKKKGEF
jgi:hypothetical protein